MSIMTFQLELTGRWTCLSLDISLLAEVRASCSDSQQTTFASTKGQSWRFFPLFFNYFHFRKHLNNTTGVMLSENIMDDEGRKNALFEAPIKDIEKRFWELLASRTFILKQSRRNWMHTANKCNMRQHLFVVMNRASLKHNYKSHKCFAVVRQRRKMFH